MRVKHPLALPERQRLESELANAVAVQDSLRSQLQAVEAEVARLAQQLEVWRVNNPSAAYTAPEVNSVASPRKRRTQPPTQNRGKEMDALQAAKASAEAALQSQLEVCCRTRSSFF